jgi:SAM-dependent methyltransferase
MVSESERIIDLYQRHAKAWAAERGTRLVEAAWLDRFRSLLPSDGAVLDIGCGSGDPIARYLIERGHAVTGVDSSPEMIDLCRGRFPDGDWRICDMRKLSVDRTFSGVLAWDSFFHLCHDDQRRMFSIFRGHAAPDAALLFTSGPSHGEAIGELKGEPLYHASLDSAEYRKLLNANGFEVVAHVVEDPTCGHRTIWLARQKSEPAHF